MSALQRNESVSFNSGKDQIPNFIKEVATVTACAEQTRPYLANLHKQVEPMSFSGIC